MKETRGNMFAYIGRSRFKLFITTNGFVKKDGTAVMGAGTAAQAVKIFQDENINLPDLLGKALMDKGNVITRLTTQLYTFPVKEAWYEKASLRLIKKSVSRLNEIIEEDNDKTKIYVLPRPGCGNGGLKWERVKPLLESLPDRVWVICSWGDPQWKK